MIEKGKELNFENFIDDFVDTKINVILVKFNNTSSNIDAKFKTLKIKESKTPENIDLSIQII